MSSIPDPKALPKALGTYQNQLLALRAEVRKLRKEREGTVRIRLPGNDYMHFNHGTNMEQIAKACALPHPFLLRQKANLFRSTFSGSLPDGFYSVEDPEKYALKPLNPQVGTSKGGPSINKLHAPATLKEAPFQPVEINTEKWDEFVSSPFDDEQPPPDFAQEATVRRRFTNVLEAVVRALDLRQELQVLEEITVRRFRPDAWIVRVGGVPVGIVEVKNPPDKGAFNFEDVAGQVYDYLQVLRSFHGICHAFAIVSTYNETKIFWLPGSEKAAASKTLEEASQQTPAPTTAPASDEERLVYCSESLPIQQPRTLLMIASAILKMQSSPLRTTGEVEDGRSYIVLAQNRWYWTHRKKITLHRNKPPPKNTRAFVLVQNVHNRQAQNTWLACSVSGCACTIHIPRKSYEGTLQLEQLRVAVEGSGGTVRDITAHNRPALLMPYWAEVDFNNPIHRQLALDAISKFVNNTKSRIALDREDLKLVQIDGFERVIIATAKPSNTIQNDDLALAIDAMKENIFPASVAASTADAANSKVREESEKRTYDFRTSTNKARTSSEANEEKRKLFVAGKAATLHKKAF